MAQAGWVDNAEVRIINVGYCSIRKLRCSNGMAREWTA